MGENTSFAKQIALIYIVDRFVVQMFLTLVQTGLLVVLAGTPGVP